MPMDGVMLGFVARQLDTVLRDGRVDRVIQPEKDEIHLMIRAQGVNHRLVLSAAASAARVHLSEHAKTGPMEPPMFCMLLRKYLCGGRVLAVRRIAGDRILEIDISNLSELGDPVTRTMVVEIMGRHSNIILRAADGRIVDAVRHVGQDISRVRQVLPGLTYAYPPAQGKLNPETATAEEIALRLAQEGGKLEKAIGACVAGFSPQAAREAAARIGMNGSSLVSEIDVQAAAGALYGYLREMPSLSPCVVTLDDAGTPTDVFPFPQMHLPAAQTAQYADPSAALDAYFYERDRRDRLNQRSASLAHALKNHIERCEKKIAIQNEALEGAARMEEYRQNCFRPICIGFKRANRSLSWKIITAKTASRSPSRWTSRSPLRKTPSGISSCIKRRAARGRLRQNKRKKPSRNSNIWSRWRTICANARMRAVCRNCGRCSSPPAMCASRLPA